MRHSNNKMQSNIQEKNHSGFDHDKFFYVLNSGLSI